MNFRDRVAQNIPDLIRARGLSQEELAHQADVSRGHMGQVETAKFAASFEWLEIVARSCLQSMYLRFRLSSGGNFR
ncbi:hypothetical protein PRI8871_03333 [Pseudoprimorskyibacter insulae]|uniref:HTH cro/C1-type domain-containing protein n=1 Tax=Pseudoprimorskyibacter insulae TaxID=1695997 RepID=A0A2R8B074_9RHOB|nr:hypothetical protein PRI8871_03333 [Pseudoprimorskyibacter insulae]